MADQQISSEERLKAARKRFEELKRKNKIPLARTSGGLENVSPVPSNEPSTDQNTPQTQYNTSKTNNNDNGSNNAEISELRDTIQAQTGQLKRFKDENTELKLEHMHLKDKVVELEKKVRELSNKVSQEYSKNPIYSEPSGKLLAPSPVIDEVPLSIPVSEPILETQSQIPANSGDYEERLLAWKGWQVDMRAWNVCQGMQVAI